ncbi:hypothetical protein K438DRAFT_1771672 [Mycena galopus ATCC 62051]|nr:hypothetical protein K438DRAFT_1771672 [Mycena galopus ATCC 62051]
MSCTSPSMFTTSGNMPGSLLRITSALFFPSGVDLWTKIQSSYKQPCYAGGVFDKNPEYDEGLASAGRAVILIFTCRNCSHIQISTTIRRKLTRNVAAVSNARLKESAALRRMKRIAKRGATKTLWRAELRDHFYPMTQLSKFAGTTRHLGLNIEHSSISIDDPTFNNITELPISLGITHLICLLGTPSGGIALGP